GWRGVSSICCQSAKRCVLILPTVRVGLLQIGNVVHFAVAVRRRTVGRTVDAITTCQRQAEGIDRLHRGPVQEVPAPEPLGLTRVPYRSREPRTDVVRCGGVNGIEVAILLDNVE